MALSGRGFYLGFLPFVLTLVFVAFVGVKFNYFKYWTASRKEREFMDYQSSAHKRSGPGEQGLPFTVTGSVLGSGDVVNMEVNRRVDTRRTIKDFRHDRCKDRTYDSPLPQATVIVSYRNEDLTLLLRTIHSVINRSPPRYLQNILLLPYGNSTDINKIETYVTQTWPDGLVRVIPANDLDNLYEARMRGVKEAGRSVLVFLQSHVEVSEGWLEPLLGSIADDPLSVAVSVIDSIDPNTLEHTASETNQNGGFFFNFTMHWHPLSNEEIDARIVEPTYPIRNPVISGEAFAVASVYLDTLGGFQPEMFTRGLDLEFSFRVWMCRGSVKILPCSRVAHLTHALEAYDELDKATEEKAMIQLAEVWMDEYRRLLYMYRKSIISEPYGGDLAKDHLWKLREECSGFEWYLDNIYTDRFLHDENVYSWGVVRNPLARLCLSTVAMKTRKRTASGLVIQTYCDHSSNIDQTFSYTFDKQIRQEESACLSSEGKVGSSVYLTSCRTHSDDILWDYNKEDCFVKHHKSGLCLTSMGKGNDTVTLQPCTDPANEQVWTFLYYLVT